MPTVLGAGLSFGLRKPQNGVADPEGNHLVVLARDPAGYARLARTISAAQMRGEEKGKPLYNLSELAQAHAGHCLVLTRSLEGTGPTPPMRYCPPAPRT